MSDSGPIWKNMSHHEKYLLLYRNRIRHCQTNIKYIDESEKEYFLDGRYIRDIPSFYLSSGEAINGENGYFGTCLDSTEDCLCGGFGVIPPITIHITNAKGIEDSLSEMAWV
ncbi:hypothetical protein MNBD_GAMMA12-2677 [hydrothermal vent metagenome]|uniref:Uncharacterized protein n=1 Tax=hydrothermal vent metagenome TaxID=652676 RepID=A0A3B0YH16_9ZZZZ